MKILTATMILLLSSTQVAQRPPAAPAQPAPQPPVRTAPVVAQPPETERQVRADLRLQALSQLSRGTGSQLGDEGLWGQACQTVLVVPTPELLGSGAETNGFDGNQAPTTVDGGDSSPEGASRIAQITEDMTVMCRILDKVAASTRPPGYPVGVNALPRLYGNEESRTQGLYLAGYGALFFVPVDIPLQPPQQEPPQPQGESAADPVWAQTVEELRGSPVAGRPTTAPPLAYDAQQVENLKATLIKSLRHAANLRLASAQDIITLVVGPQDGQVRIGAIAPAKVAMKPGRTAGGRAAVKPGAGFVSSAPSDRASVLILRVSKADVDAFAKGEIPISTFAEKVQTLWSWTNRGPGEPPTSIRYERYPEAASR